MWHWYNPVFSGPEDFGNKQVNARLKNKQLGVWYEIWWELHQQGLKRAIGEKYDTWLGACVEQKTPQYGSKVAAGFVPLLTGVCVHKYGGLAW